MATRRRLLSTCAGAGAALLLLGGCDRSPTDSTSGGLRRPNFAVGDVAATQPLPVSGQDVSIAFDGTKIGQPDRILTCRLNAGGRSAGTDAR